LKSCLYNIDTVDKYAIITEGPTDVWRIGNGAVCLFGKQISNDQVKLLIEKNPKKIIIMLDSLEKDPGANISAKAIVNQLSLFFDEIYIVSIDYGDPAQLSHDEINEYLSDLI